LPSDLWRAIVTVGKFSESRFDSSVWIVLEWTRDGLGHRPTELHSEHRSKARV